MKLSPDEDLFLRHWMFDEVHFRDGPGLAKKLQLEHRAAPADLATLVAAAIPDPAMQEVIGDSPPPTQVPRWPWSETSFRARIDDARGVLAQERKATRVVAAVR
jgi:hypothetical protein